MSEQEPDYNLSDLRWGDFLESIREDAEMLAEMEKALLVDGGNCTDEGDLAELERKIAEVRGHLTMLREKNGTEVQHDDQPRTDLPQDHRSR